MVMGSVGFPTMLLLVAFSLPLRNMVGAHNHKTPLPPPRVIFNFGDSNSDTGGLAAGLGFNFDLPNGRLFFHHATGRICDGRLVIDFICEKMKMDFLRPYLDSLGSNFKNGANFAIIGAATLPKYVPFSLAIQTQQFARFHSRVLDLTAQGWNTLLDEKGFRNAVYMLDIGQNDLSAAFYSGSKYPQILQQIPSFISEIKDSIVSIYKLGGRKFWVHNTGPLGCLPEKLAKCHKDPSDLDHAGCLITFNNAAKAFNSALDVLCNQLRSQLHNASIVYTDVYSIKYDLISNFTKYGSTMVGTTYGDIIPKKLIDVTSPIDLRVERWPVVAMGGLHITSTGTFVV